MAFYQAKICISGEAFVNALVFQLFSLIEITKSEETSFLLSCREEKKNNSHAFSFLFQVNPEGVEYQIICSYLPDYVVSELLWYQSMLQLNVYLLVILEFS